MRAAYPKLKVQNMNASKDDPRGDMIGKYDTAVFEWEAKSSREFADKFSDTVGRCKLLGVRY